MTMESKSTEGQSLPPQPTRPAEPESSGSPTPSKKTGRKRSHRPDAVEPTCVGADEPKADIAGEASAAPRKKRRKNMHSSFMWSGSAPHKGWEPSYIAMAKCDLCSKSSRGVVQKCDECKLTVCKECYDGGDMENDPVHQIEPGTFNWEIPKKTKAASAASRSERQRIRTTKPRRGKGAERRGGQGRNVASKNPAPIPIIDITGPSEQPSGEGTGAAPYPTPRQAHGEEDNRTRVDTVSFRPIEPRPNTIFRSRHLYPPSPIYRTGPRSEFESASANTPYRSHEMTGYKPTFKFGVSESSHTNDGNNQLQDRLALLEPRDGRDMGNEPVYQRENGHTHNRQPGFRGFNGLEAHSLAAQKPRPYGDRTHLPGGPTNNRPGIQLPPINVALGSISPRLPLNSVLTPLHTPQPNHTEQTRQRSYLGGPPANKPSQLSVLPEPIHPQYNYERLTSTRISDLGPELAHRSLATNREFPGWSLDVCLRYEICQTWEQGALRQHTQDETAAFQLLLGATYHAAAILGLNMEKNAARQWLCEQEKRMMERGLKPLCIVE